jgi:cytoskeletal protein RodZ
MKGILRVEPKADIARIEAENGKTYKVYKNEWKSSSVMREGTSVEFGVDSQDSVTNVRPTSERTQRSFGTTILNMEVQSKNYDPQIRVSSFNNNVEIRDWLSWLFIIWMVIITIAVAGLIWYVAYYQHHTGPEAPTSEPPQSISETQTPTPSIATSPEPTVKPVKTLAPPALAAIPAQPPAIPTATVPTPISAREAETPATSLAPMISTPQPTISVPSNAPVSGPSTSSN